MINAIKNCQEKVHIKIVFGMTMQCIASFLLYVRPETLNYSNAFSKGIQSYETDCE